MIIEINNMSREKTISKNFYDDEIEHYDKDTNTVYLKEKVRRRGIAFLSKKSKKDEDYWYEVENDNLNEEALFFDKVIKARKIIDEDKYWLDELETN